MDLMDRDLLQEGVASVRNRQGVEGSGPEDLASARIPGVERAIPSPGGDDLRDDGRAPGRAIRERYSSKAAAGLKSSS